MYVCMYEIYFVHAVKWAVCVYGRDGGGSLVYKSGLYSFYIPTSGLFEA